MCVGSQVLKRHAKQIVGSFDAQLREKTMGEVRHSIRSSGLYYYATGAHGFLVHRHEDKVTLPCQLMTTQWIYTRCGAQNMW